MSAHTKTELEALFSAVGQRAEAAGVFGSVVVSDAGITCAAQNPAEPADYRVYEEQGNIWVSLSMKDRWQSESIESELVHSGDKLNELIDDELADLGIESPKSTFEHFRSPELEFVFRSKVPSCDAETVGAWLLGYEQCFRQLGDMDVSDEED